MRRLKLAIPRRGEVWLVDMGYAAKTRPALVLSIPLEEDERALTTVVPHTTSQRVVNSGWHYPKLHHFRLVRRRLWDFVELVRR